MEYTKTNLRISTMVITANWGVPIKLNKLSELLKNVMIPLWYPAEGIIKYEHKNTVIGLKYKDIFTNRKVTSKTFFNQSTVILRRRIIEEKEDNWKEVNVKLFDNGGIQMTGVYSEEFARKSLEYLHQVLLSFEDNPFIGNSNINIMAIQLINTDYKINKFINQDALHKILINKYNLFSMLEKTIYQGINTKYFYNTDNKNNNGICQCKHICKGQGVGEGDGQCKRITMSIFRTGTIIITGARNIIQIQKAYDFLNDVFDKYSNVVLYIGKE